MTLLRLILPLWLAALAGCAGPRGAVTTLPQAQLDQDRRIAELSAAIASLGSRVDPAEAQRAADVAIRYPLLLAEQYELTAPPLWHNTLVNLGVKPRGLCVDWTRDMLTRLRELRLRTLKTHWGVANAEAVFSIEHSTAIISARGQPMHTGIVLDPWRDSGRLFWSKVSADSRYEWYPLAEVQAARRQKLAEQTPGQARTDR